MSLDFDQISPPLGWRARTIDGSEDHLIHYFKDDQTCSSGAERLKVMTSTIEDDSEDDREDPFSLLENSDVEEAALVVDSDDETDDLLDIYPNVKTSFFNCDQVPLSQ